MSLLTTMIRHLGTDVSKADSQDSLAVSETSQHCQSLFVTTDLEIRKFAWVRTGEIDIEQNGKVFRLLSPKYFAWLRSRMVTAQAAHKAGKLPEDAWNTLRQRFNALQELAIREFGKESLQEVLQSFSTKNYRPPQNQPTVQIKTAESHEKSWLYPQGMQGRHRQPVTSQAVAKVDAIREEAMAKGWSEARLYQNQGRFQFPCGEDYGLVCFVDGDQEIGEVTERSIEIIHGPRSGRPSTLRFYNPDVPQPWMKKVED
jgi:hypothetical protein